jgi:hypothetical protein
MGDLGYWLAFGLGTFVASLFDPATWIVFVVAALFASDRTSTAVVWVVAVIAAIGGAWMSMDYYRRMGAYPPVSGMVIYHGGKLLVCALGIAFNRLILQRIEKRFAGVLEKD